MISFIPSPVIHWFRRDLRLRDNLGLEAALGSGQPVVPLFIFDPAILNSPRISPARVRFMLEALQALDTDLRKFGSALLVRHGAPVKVLPQVVEEIGAVRLFFNADYTPFSRQRDDGVAAALNIPVNGFHDRLMAVPGEIVKESGDPYSVYTPFMKCWRQEVQPAPVAEYQMAAEQFHTLDGIENPDLPTLADLGCGQSTNVPEASEQAAHRQLADFISQRICVYEQERDRLGNCVDDPYTATSFLSPYIRFGLISLRQIHQAAARANQQAAGADGQKSVRKFVDEIIWHEFYTHILWHFPQVKTENFNRKYDVIEWQETGQDLQAWQDGQTGYPAIDAAMRQLNATGWMHNRARMITASFLTKDLLIDWRRGELYFMQSLIDGDLAANNGGWQWAASTGTDAQPYFRIFNPVAQSKKFDPDGRFIRRWVPELRDVPDQFIHEPWNLETPPRDYPARIVDHASARKRALQMFQAMKTHDP
jgi:deoxyribodipyrimidine photo-lyase